mmetsp:Transcript_75170/g.237609  ORF Transcript_75170/g.237609 Transcript_75170/m.237609 type:complete len:325 (-) Transcript_75170:394-1368(-)
MPASLLRVTGQPVALGSPPAGSHCPLLRGPRSDLPLAVPGCDPAEAAVKADKSRRGLRPVRSRAGCADRPRRHGPWPVLEGCLRELEPAGPSDLARLPLPRVSRSASSSKAALSNSSSLRCQTPLGGAAACNSAQRSCNSLRRSSLEAPRPWPEASSLQRLSMCWARSCSGRGSQALAHGRRPAAWTCSWPQAEEAVPDMSSRGGAHGVGANAAEGAEEGVNIGGVRSEPGAHVAKGWSCGPPPGASDGGAAADGALQARRALSGGGLPPRRCNQLGKPGALPADGLAAPPHCGPLGRPSGSNAADCDHAGVSTDGKLALPSTG